MPLSCLWKLEIVEKMKNWILSSKSLCMFPNFGDVKCLNINDIIIQLCYLISLISPPRPRFDPPHPRWVVILPCILSADYLRRTSRFAICNALVGGIFLNLNSLESVLALLT